MRRTSGHADADWSAGNSSHAAACPVPTVTTNGNAGNICEDPANVLTKHVVRVAKPTWQRPAVAKLKQKSSEVLPSSKLPKKTETD